MSRSPNELLDLVHRMDHLEPLYAQTRKWIRNHIPGDRLVFYQPDPLEDLAFERVDRATAHVLRGEANPSSDHIVEDLRGNQSGIIDLSNDLVHLEDEERWFGAIETSGSIKEEQRTHLRSLTRILNLGARFHLHKNRSDFSEWLLNLHRSLIGPEDFEDLLNHMFDGLAEELGSQEIGYYAERGGDFELIGSQGFTGDQYQNRRVLVREDLLQEGLGEEPYIQVESEEGTGLLLPLETGEELVGLLGLFDPSWGDEPGNHMLSRLEAVKTVTALVIHSFRLQNLPEESVIHDQLTGLKTPSYFRRRLGEEIERVRRYGPACSLMVLDIDRFSDLNEEFGFSAGDNTLRELGRLLQNNVRSTDLACRFENDQFAVLFPNTSVEEALVAAKRLQVLAAEPFFTFRGEPIGVRFSAGLSAFPGDAESVDGLFKQSKLALYEAKQTGKDQVVTARNVET